MKHERDIFRIMIYPLTRPRLARPPSPRGRGMRRLGERSEPSRSWVRGKKTALLPLFCLLFTALCLLTPGKAYADCAAPTAPVGSLQFFVGDDTFKYCDSTDTWIDWGSGGVASAGGSDTEIQLNSGGLLYASAGLTYTSTGRLLLDSGSSSVVITGGNETMTGGFNTILGVEAGRDLTSGAQNTLIGYQAGAKSLATAAANVFVGYLAGTENTAGSSNTYIGVSAGRYAISGLQNTNVGAGAGLGNNSGHFNVIMGSNAAKGVSGSSNISQNVFIGTTAAELIQTGADRNVAIGYSVATALTTGTDNILLGYNVDVPTASTSNYLNIGNLLTGDLSTGVAYISSTAALDIPAGTTGERPTGDNGMLRYNSDTNKFEGFQASSWQDLITAGGTPATPDRGIQLNSGGVFYASADLTYTSTGDFIVGSYQTGDTGTGNEDSRMYFDKSKSAFRAGSVSGTQWDDGSVGDFSVAMGRNATASGQTSVAIHGSATSEDAVAIGDGALATANGAVAIGVDRTATGTRAVSLGFNTDADGVYSFSMGRRADVTGDYSAVWGLGQSTGTTPVVSGQSSYGIFMGDHNGVDFASASTLGLFGGRMVIDPAVPATTLFPSTGAQALELDVEGDIGAINYCDEDGNNCFTAAGVAGATVAAPDRGVQFNSGGGFAAESTFTYTSVGRLGIGTATPEATLHVGGGDMLLDNDQSLRWKTNSGSLGQVMWLSVGDSLTINNPTTGAINFRMGSGGNMATVNTGGMDIIEGSLDVNDKDTSGNTSLEILRLSHEDSNSAGSDGIGSHIRFEAESSTEGTYPEIARIESVLDDATDASKDASLRFYTLGTDAGVGSNTATEKMRIDSAGFVGIGTTAPTELLYISGGNLYVDGDIDYTGDLTDVSDMRLKEDIKPLRSMLDKVSDVNGYSYHMKDDIERKMEYGVLAQELEEIFPELVKTAEDEMGTKSVNYIGLIAPMIEATKELKAENEALKAELDSVKTKLGDINDLRHDVKALKAHTGYGINKAEIGVWVLVGMGGMGFMIFFGGLALRTHRREG